MTSPNSPPPNAGFELEKIFANELSFQGHPDASAFSDEEMTFTASWDWKILDEGRFLVSLGIQLNPSRPRPETTRASIAGIFQLGTSAPTVPVPDFVRVHASTLLMPFLREALASLTSRGLHGQLLLPPMNVIELMKGFEFSGSTGATQLQAFLIENPALAARYGAGAAQ